MKGLIFNLQRFADGPGGSPPDGGGGSSSSSVSWSGATEITSSTLASGKSFTSTTADQNALLINTSSSAKVTLSNPTVAKSGGTSASDNYSFYGINSAVMCKGGGTTSIVGGTVTSSSAGANGIFSYGANNGTTNATGDGTTVYIKNTKITTTGQGSGGIMTTYGGTTIAENLTISTSGGSSAPIRTDRGGGWVTVTGGSYESSGTGSPAIYSTADITVNQAALKSNHSEGVCIEGTGSIALNNCTLTASNDSLNGNATFKDTIMIYQSQSGDASDGTSEFSMTGGVLNSKKGHVFHVTNTSAVISLNGVTINNSDSNDVLLSVCDDGWSGASNIATLKANNQVLDGDILVGSDSTLYLNVSDSSTLKGSISGKISNASGSSVSTSLGTVNVTLDSSSKWYLEENTYISSFSGTAANVITGSYKLYVNGTALSGTSTSDSGSSDDTLTSGLTYNSAKTAVTVDSDYDEATLSSYESTVVTIDASSRSTALAIIGNAKANVISGGSGADTINGGKGADTLTGNDGADVFLYASGTGNDVITDYVSGTDKIKITSGSISKSTVSGSDVALTIGSGKLTIKNAKGKTLNLINSAGTESTTVIGTSTSEDDPEAVIVTNSTSATVTVDSSIKTIDASTRSKSVKITGNSLNNTIFGSTAADTINGGSGNDSILGENGNDKLFGDEGNDSIYGGVGNDTLNGDTGNDYLSGDAGTDKLYGGDGADTLAGGKGNDSLTGGNGADVFIFGTGDGTDVILDYEPGTDKIKISSGSITSSSISGNNTIFKIGSAKLTVKNSAGSAIDIVDADGNETSQTYGMLTYNSAKTLLTVNKSFTGTLDYTDYESTVTKINASKVTNSIYAIGNAKNNSIKTGTGDDTLDGGSDGNDTLTGGKGSDVFIYRGGNDFITDYTAGEDTIKIASGTIDTYAIKSSNVVLTIGDNTLTIKNAKNKEITITNSSGSTSTITYPTVPAGLTYNSGLTMLTADENFTGSEIDLANYVSTVTKVNATKLTSAVKIVGNSKSNSLVGGSGNDTLDGSIGTNKLTGGDGSDVFLYNGDGSTTILDYAEGVDKIKINDSITSAKASGTNFIFTVGSKKLTVKNGAKQKITVVDSTNKTSYYGSILNVTDSDKAKITATTYVATIDASERTTDINIVGNRLANTIYGGSGVNTINGGAGADYIVGGNKGNSLVGGAGKDTLIGGSGNDSFIGGADGNIFIAGVGADYIKDYSAKDTIKLTSGSLTSATLNNSDVIIETSLGSITLKSAKNKQVTVVDSSDNTLMSQTFNNSITSYSNYDERWFIEDELIGNDDLNEIVNDDISLLTTNENEEINAVQFENASQSIEQSHIGRRKNFD